MATLKTSGAGEMEQSLKDLRVRLSRIHHDINNPVSIISGNTQLLMELARALEVEEDFSGPLEDIEAAIDKLTASVDRLMEVRRMLSELAEAHSAE